MKYHYLSLILMMYPMMSVSFEIRDCSVDIPQTTTLAVSSLVSIVMPSIDAELVSQLLAGIQSKLGTSDQPAQEDTVLSVLGNAGSTLGISISQALVTLLDRSETDTANLQANFCDPIFIYQSDFDPAGTTSYVINNPGVYKLAEDITYNATVPGTAAIVINSSDVILDLQCFTLQQGNAVINTHGILINPNLTDFKIKNGHIKNFTDTGVLVSTGCARFSLSDFVCMNIGLRGVALTGPTSPTVANIVHGILENLQIIESSHRSNSIFFSPLLMQGCADIQVLNCNFDRNSNMVGVISTFNVIYLNNCQRSSLKNVQIINNIASQSLTGILIQNSSFCTFVGVDMLNNSTRSISPIATFNGISVSASSTNNEFYQCRILGHQFPGNVSGIGISAGCSDMFFWQCEVSNNITTGVGNVRGFSFIVGQRITIKDCIARHNVAPNSTVVLPNFGAFGYDLGSCTDCYIEHSIAEDQNAGAASNSVGFRISGGVGNTFYECKSCRQDMGYRIEPLESIDNLFSKNVAAKNGINYSQFPLGSHQDAATIADINSLNAPWTNVGIN